MPAKNAQPTVAVTGASGALGRQVADRLVRAEVPQLLVGRDPGRITPRAGAEIRGPAAYADSAAMRRALTGADTLVLVSAHPTGRRLEEHVNVTEAAIAVGVKRVIYVSLADAGPTAIYRNARDHWLTERFLADRGVRHTIVRAGFYAATPAALADENWVVRGPGGTGRAAFVTHDDLAEVIAVLAAESAPTSPHDGAVMLATGPEALSLEALLGRAAAATGRPYRYEPQTLEEAFTSRHASGVSGEQIESWLSWYQAIALGRLDQVTDVVQTVTGHPARDVVTASWWPEPATAW